ncbi:CST complex subunit CTC1 isoform X1 [Tanacetum coccineum]
METSISDLLHRHRPITAATTLFNHPPPTTQTHHSFNPQNNHNILTPLNSPSFLTGTLTLNLNLNPTCLNPSCFTFTDHSASICCDIIDFDLRIIGRRINVLAWNFVPVKPGRGFLEIIRWGLHQSENIDQNLNGFYLNNVLPVYKESLVAKTVVYGLLESVSPVTNVPCSGSKNGIKNLDGFLAEVFVCECELCSCRDRVMWLDGENNGCHRFTKLKVVYFCGDASVWYGVISRMVGGVLVMSGLKKKMVFLGEGKSLMMYVTTDKSIIHLPIAPVERLVKGRNTTNERKGLFSVYIGSITAVYMQGMVVELDEKVLLLVTDHQLPMPHSLRVGAIVTVRNFHKEDPKFAWTKIVLFGSCCKTSIRVNVFSPLESRCYQSIGSRSLLRKFIESLTFSARLWLVLLVVSSMRKKFAGILSEMEILGSKHMEGLVQKYCSSCLPLSVFRFRHGILSEYCQHDICGCGKKVIYDPPKLVVPISNLISQCEDMFIKSLNASGTEFDKNHQYNSIVCGGISHDQPIRKILKSEDMNVVLLASLKISDYSGKLQLIDATGSIDIVIPDLPSINDFSVVMEGFPRQLETLESLSTEPFSFGNIFNHFRFAGKKRFTIYIYCYMKDAKSRNRVLCPGMDMVENLKELENGKFHLLLLVHKFPVQQKYPGDKVVSNNSSIYAETIVLPWNLVVRKRDIDSVESSNGGDSFNEKWCDVVVNKDPSCKGTAWKLLLEFKSDGFSKYEGLRIGGYYLIKYHDKDLVCTANDGKVLVNSKSHLWSISFSAAEAAAGPTTTQSFISSYHSVNVQYPHSQQLEIPVLKSIDGSPEFCPDIYVHLSADHLSFLEVKLRELKADLIQPTNLTKGLLNSSSSLRTMMSASMPSGDSSVNLSVGNLIAVQGDVVAVHSSNQSRLLNRLNHQVLRGHCHIVPGVTKSVCVHVLVEHVMVKIYSSLSEHSYPTGFGPGVKAKFHRVLLTADGDLLKLTPASFIELDSIIIDNDQCRNESEDTFLKSVVETATAFTTGPATLISEIMQFTHHKQMRFHCRIVMIYVLALERNNEFLQSLTTVKSDIPPVKIPLAGFIIDDGSSSCCCWTDNERVVTLLGLHGLSELKRSRSLHKSANKKMEPPCSYTMSRVSKILDRHGTVVMKNMGSVSNSSCLDVAVSVNSDNVVNQSDEQFLKSLVLQACSSNTWDIVGTVLDSKAVNQLEQHLQRFDLTMPPLQSIWAYEVSHVDTLNEARSILEELLKS